jgi:hypothetical protein
MKQTNTNILNYIIWGGVIAGVGYYFYTKTKAYKQAKLNKIVKQYPGWEINNNKKTTPVFMYAKPFKAFKPNGDLDFEAWLIYYNTVILKIYTRGQKEEKILEATYKNALDISVTSGYGKGKSFKGKNLNDLLSKIFEQKITGI